MGVEIPSFSICKTVHFKAFISLSTGIANNKTNTLVEKWATDLTRHFSDKDIKMTNKHMKRCLSLFIRGMQTKIIIRYYSMPINMFIILKQKKQTQTNKKRK